MTIKNVLRAYANPRYAPAMTRKVLRRALGRAERPGERSASAEWCRAHAEDGDEFARNLDPLLWRESWEAGAEIRHLANETLGSLGVSLGGGGNYPLLYFLTRHLRPRTVVESGVAAGYSSRAFLLAMQANGGGELYSSDLPYFRLSEPEHYVGVLVDESLRRDWHLYIEGDRRNLPRIRSEVARVDLLHYDSDKSYQGREYALKALAPVLGDDAIVVMDDIQDNLFFRDYVERRGCGFRVISFEGKFIGVVGI